MLEGVDLDNGTLDCKRGVSGVTPPALDVRGVNLAKVSCWSALEAALDASGNTYHDWRDGTPFENEVSFPYLLGRFANHSGGTVFVLATRKVSLNIDRFLTRY